jgi:hypothetical protein
MVYSRVERVFIHEHYLASKSSAAVREAFSNAYTEKYHNTPAGNEFSEHRKCLCLREGGGHML